MDEEEKAKERAASYTKVQVYERTEHFINANGEKFTYIAFFAKVVLNFFASYIKQHRNTSF